jgi:hypothetical protein
MRETIYSNNYIKKKIKHLIIKKVVYKVAKWIKKENFVVKILKITKNNKNIINNNLLIIRLNRLNKTKTFQILKTNTTIIKLWNLMKALYICQMMKICKKWKTKMKYINLINTNKILMWLS